MRILVVDDLPEWCEALCKMYEAILGRHQSKGGVQAAMSFSAARRLLDQGDWDILSLDINLRSTATKGEAGRLEHANGLDLLNYAKGGQLATGVIVISACVWDEELDSAVIFDEGELVKVRTSLGQILERMFPGRSLFLPKSPPARASVDDSIAAWREVLNLRILRGLATRQQLAIPPPYEVTLDGMLEKVGIRRRGTRRKEYSVQIPGARDRNLLIKLAINRQAGDAPVDKETVVRTLREESDADEVLAQLAEGTITQNKFDKRVWGYLKSFYKRLGALGIRTEDLVETVRGKGIRLLPTVEIRGVRSAPARGLGMETEDGYDRLHDDLAAPDANPADLNDEKDAVC